MLNNYIKICISIFLSFPLTALSQQNLPTYDNKWVHFGISLGLNHTDFRIVHKSDFLSNDTLFIIESTPKKGINMGIIGDLRLGEYFNLRFIPTLSFSHRQIEYTFTGNNLKKKNIESTFVDFPLHIKYKSTRYKNFRIYVIAGGKYSIDMISQSNVQLESGDEIKPRLYRSNLAYEFGAGIDLYYPIFKFSIELKKTNGINNVLLPESHIWSSEIEKLFSQVLLLSMHFE